MNLENNYESSMSFMIKHFWVLSDNLTLNQTGGELCYNKVIPGS